MSKQQQSQVSTPSPQSTIIEHMKDPGGTVVVGYFETNIFPRRREQKCNNCRAEAQFAVVWNAQGARRESLFCKPGVACETLARGKARFNPKPQSQPKAKLKIPTFSCPITW